MKLINLIVAAVVSVAGFASAAQADAAWPNKGRVLALVADLQEAVERLDEAAHAHGAPDEVIEILHHYEETVTAALEEYGELSYEDAKHELEHLREDIFLVQDTLEQYNYWSTVEAIEAWNPVPNIYVALERAMDYP